MAFSVLDVLFNTPESVNTIDRLIGIMRFITACSISSARWVAKAVLRGIISISSPCSCRMEILCVCVVYQRCPIDRCATRCDSVPGSYHMPVVS